MEAGGGRLRARRDLLHPGVDALGLVSKLLLVELRLLHSLFGRGGAEQEGVPPHLPRDGDPQRGSDHNHRREDGGGGWEGGHLKVKPILRLLHRLVEVLLPHEAPGADGVGDHVDLDPLPTGALAHGSRPESPVSAGQRKGSVSEGVRLLCPARRNRFGRFAQRN